VEEAAADAIATGAPAPGTVIEVKWISRDLQTPREDESSSSEDEEEAPRRLSRCQPTIRAWLELIDADNSYLEAEVVKYNARSNTARLRFSGDAKAVTVTDFSEYSPRNLICTETWMEATVGAATQGQGALTIWHHHHLAPAPVRFRLKMELVSNGQV